jgi:DNA replication and repair protein RecF
MMGTSLYGVHKDDIAVRLNGKDAKIYASQGQQRSLALSMKLAEGEMSKKISGEYPVFLLDDVLSELDGDRRKYLLDKKGDKQIIITSCQSEELKEIADKTIEVQNGIYT